MTKDSFVLGAIDMSSLGWIARWRIPVVLMIVFLIYVAMISAFLDYQNRRNERLVIRHQTIAKCLDSGGHIGRGDTCWQVTPNENNQVVP